MSTKSETSTVGFLEHFSGNAKEYGSVEANFLAQTQLRCLERRLQEALEQNGHSAVIDLRHEIPLIAENKKLLENKGFQCKTDINSCLYYIFFPHVRNVENLLRFEK